MVSRIAADPDRQARPLKASRNISDDKAAGSWLLAIPSPDLSLSKPVFQEALSAHLCCPSPAVTAGDWVGRTTPGDAGVAMDSFGDAVMRSNAIP